MQGRLRTREEILAVLRPDAVLAHFGIAARASGDEYRARVCPACGTRSRDCVCIHRVTGHWFDHAHGCKGDLLGMVAGLANLDCTSDFKAVLALAATIAGVSEAVEDLHVEKVEARVRVEPSPPLDDARGRAGAVWSRLPTASPSGAEYLTRRGLGSLSANADVVRYAPLPVEPLTSWGRRVARLLGRPAVCVPVHAVAEHSIVNVVARRLDVRSGDDPKVVSLPGIKKVLDGRVLGTFGSWSSFRARPRDVVVVEGVFDYLTALHLLPEMLVLGADGAALLPKIGRLIASSLRAAGVRVFLVPHNDEAGYAHGRAMCDELVRASVPVERIHLVDVGRHKDLNDAFRAGEVPRVD